VGFDLGWSIWVEKVLKEARENTTNLAESGSRGIGRSIVEWVLVVAVSVTVSGDDDDTEDF
jgi:hypothetical protein